MGKIKNFTDLNVWKEGHRLVLSLYKATANFPQAEKHSLADQMRRAAVSITSNIAEGFSRQTSKEKLQFYYHSKGSLTEIQNQILIARDIGYLNKTIFSSLAEQTVIVSKLLSGLVKKLKS